MKYRLVSGKQTGDGLKYWSHLVGVAVFALDPALTVEPEAVRALVEPVEFRWRRVTGHRNTSPLLPAAILGTLSLEGPSSRKR